MLVTGKVVIEADHWLIKFQERFQEIKPDECGGADYEQRLGGLI